MSTSTLFLIVIGALVVGLSVMYFLISFAVQAATADLLRNNQIMLNLKIAEMKKAGLANDVEEINRKFETFDKLRKLKGQGHLTAQEFEKKVQALNIEI